MLFPLLVLFVLQAAYREACAASAPAAPGPAARSVAVLDPVDLITRRADTAWGGFLRRRFSADAAWKVIGLDSMRAREKVYSFSAYRDCHEFQCAFDAGNVFAAEYVVFSSLARLDGVYAYTLNLLHVPSSRFAWSGVGQAGPGKAGDSRLSLEAAWTRRISRLAPGRPPAQGGGKPGQITVLDLSRARWAPALAIAERAATHLNAARAFDIMGEREQEELVKALGIDRAGFIPTDSAIYDLGRRMGVTHLVASRLVEEPRQGMRLELGYYDIAKGRKIKAGRSGRSREAVDALRFETAFFSSLFEIGKDGEDGLEGMGGAGAAWLGATAGAAAGAAAIAGGYMAYRFDRASRDKYGRIGDSRSRESALALRAEAASLERRSRIWGGVGIAGAMAGAALLVISF